MSLRRYPSYGHTSVEWLNEVPVHWKVKRLKFIAAVQGGIAKGKDIGGQETVRVPYLRVANVQDGYLDLTEIATIEIAANEIGRYLLQPGDVLMNEGGDFDKLGRGYIWRGEIVPCSHQNHVFAVRPHSVSPEWLNAITGSAYAQFYFKTRSKQSTNLASISSTNLMELPVILPPAKEQEAILQFLDHEITKIGILIAEQQRLVELLKEKRHSLISHAVTKGLNPSAPMKASGVEWLGEVPAHWSVAPIRRFAKLESGHTPSRSHPEYWENCNIPWFSLADVWQIREGRDYIVETNEKVSLLGLAQSSARLLPKGTVMLSRTASVGFSAIMGVDMATTQDFANWVCGTRLESEFLLFTLRGMTGEFRRLMMGSTHNTIYMPDVQSLTIAVPPVREQEAIVGWIRHETALYDDLTLEAQSGIGLLRERQTALVSAAVTGKIDVRSLAPPPAEKEAAA